MKILSFRCCGKTENAVCADKAPLFSWLLDGEGKPCRQEDYRLTVVAGYGCAESGKTVWDSGWVHSAATNGILYRGETLEEMSRYLVTLQVRVGGSEEILSAELAFDTAFIHRDRMPAEWIGHGSLLRKSFSLKGEPVYALLAVTGLGYFEARINGERVGEDTLTPSYTWYAKRVEYNCYDVLSLLRAGENGIGIELGGHWQQNPDGSEQKCYQGCYYTGALRAKAYLRVLFADGTEQVIATDGSWKQMDGPVRRTGIYDGEIYDANLEQPGYSLPDFDDSRWTAVKLLGTCGDAMELASTIPQIRRIQLLPPVLVNRLDNGDFVVDFGYNYAGRCQLKVDLPAGAVVTIRHAELIYPDGSINAANLRWAKATDIFTSAGRPAVYEPRFCYHGFRYAQISGLQELSAEDIRMVEVRTSVATTGAFTSSDERLNILHDIMARTITNNYHSIPTDCHQRDERQGWMGDGQLTSAAACANFDMQYAFRKWLEDIAEEQNEEGNIPFVTAPAWAADEAFSWTCAFFEIASCLLRYYNDIDIIAKHYDGLCKYFAYLKTREDKNGLLTLRGLCDWLALEPTEERIIRDAIYYRSAVQMAEFAEALGKADKEAFLAKSIQIRDAYNKVYYSCHGFTNKNSGYYGTCYYVGQAANAIPMANGMVTPDLMPRVTEKLLYELQESMGGLKLVTGFIGTRAMIEALMLLDRNDIIWDLLHQDAYPSYGFMLAHGATTVWERWQYRTDNEMNSHCHPPLAAPDVWFYQVVAGIRGYRADKEGRGVFEIRPDLSLPLESATASQKTVFGQIAVDWKKVGGRVEMTVSVPANASAQVTVGDLSATYPDGEYRFICDGQGHTTVC